MQEIFVNLEGKIYSLSGVEKKGSTTGEPVLITFKSDSADLEVIKRKAPIDANAYSSSSLREIKDSKEGFAVTEYTHCYACAIQFYKLN
jgi:hypothetical protein